MDESDIASVVVRLAGSSPREAHDLVVANPWLLESGADDAIGGLLTAAAGGATGPAPRGWSGAESAAAVQGVWRRPGAGTRRA